MSLIRLTPLKIDQFKILKHRKLAYPYFNPEHRYVKLSMNLRIFNYTWSDHCAKIRCLLICLPDGQSFRQFETLIDINKDVSAQAKRMAIIELISR